MVHPGVFAVSGCLLAVATSELITHRLRSEHDKDLRAEFDEWRAFTVEHLDEPALLERLIRIELAQEHYNPTLYRLHDVSQGRDIHLIFDPEWGKHIQRVVDDTPITRVPTRVESTYVWSGPSRPFRVLTGPVDPKRHPGLVLQMAQSLRDLYKRERSVRVYLFLALAVHVVAAACGGIFLASRSLKPIEATVAELSGIESRNLGERLAVGEAADELDQLRGAINGMLDRLESAFNQLQSFTADAAHELRTPIAALQCRLEVALNTARGEGDYRDALDDGLQQAGQLTTLVDDLLFLARMDAEAGLPKAEDVDLQALTAELAEPFGLLAEQHEVALETRCAAGLTVWGDGHLLRRLIANLLDNALRHTPAGGRVELAVAGEGEGCHVTVADTGVGIEPEAVERIFDRFYRADSSRSREGGGAGLGLSIARRIVERHRGRIEIESAPGEGTTVHVWIPASRPQPEQG